MKLIEGIILSLLDLFRKRKLYKILSLTFLIIDMISFCTMESLDIIFSLDSDYFTTKEVIFVLKVKFNDQACCYYYLHSVPTLFDIFRIYRYLIYMFNSIFSNWGNYILLYAH